ncbi:hypothetical protein JTB14_014393 [Gonioctena quinquepunctata]|nr:hypothetical protein JTB14_014393 [Gonioctena quinquepunctata]
MANLNLYILFTVFLTGGECLIPDFLKSDYFSILRHAAVETKDILHTPVAPENVTYYFYTRENSGEYIKLDPSDLKPLVDPKKGKIVFIIHGWNSNREADWVGELRNAFLTTYKNYSVVEVDWRDPAGQFYYVSSINTWDVSKILADLILDLNKNYGVDLEDILPIGHSLGGQITGFLGKHITKETGRKLRRIIALDPAGPLFDERPGDKRLNENDAEVVQVVHSDGGTFGFKQTCGSIDFFPNGGSSQPGCKRIDLLDLTSLADPITCDHHRACDYFVEAILNPDELLATKCSQWRGLFTSRKCEDVKVHLGDLTSNERGTFFFETNKEKPYSKREKKKANAACLIGLFSTIYLNYHPKDIWKILNALGPYKPYLDASQFPCGFTLKIPDCILAVHKALTFNFFNFDDFSVTEYELYNKLQYGDMNWLVPRKFLAFIGPADNKTSHPPEFYIKYFLKNDVKTVIRLNSIIYNADAFTQVGIQHFDLIFPDGTIPPKDVLLKFLTIAEMAPAAIAVHCKAGLGRTGSLIGAYLIKHYCMTAREAIAWMRLCRPGSVIGQQQIWLEKLENWLWKLGSQYRMKKYGSGDKIPRHKYGIYSKVWPIQREKIIAESRKKIQRSFTKSQMEKISKQKKYSASMDSFSGKRKQEKVIKKLGLNEFTPYKSVSKLISSLHGVSKNITQPAMSSLLQFNNAQPRISAYPKSEYEQRNNISFETDNHKRRRTDNDRNATRNAKTQGDKLNEIKAGWYRNIANGETFKPLSQNEQYRKYLQVTN